MKENMLEQKEQKNLKVLSKIVYIIAIIGKIFATIAIPAIILVMVAVPFFMKHINLVDNEIRFDETSIEEKIEIADHDVTIKIGDTKLDDSEERAYIMVKNILQNNSKTAITWTIEICLLFALGYIFIIRTILKYVQNIFKNIYADDTPFTLDNVELIKKIGCMMIAAIIVPIIPAIIFEVLARGNLEFNFSTFSIIEVLVVFIIYYIFKYGYKLQSDSKAKIYDNK